jgi:two-component system NarL family sensor kinase
MTTAPDLLVGEYRADVLRAVERERRRLADALHDTTVQQLVLARILVELTAEEEPGSVDRLEQVRSLLDESLGQLRALVWELTPATLHQAGLLPAIDSLCDKLTARWHLHYRCHVTGEIPDVLSDALAETLVQAARELMTNAGRHARASTCEVVLAFDDDHVLLTVVDDGIGIDPKRSSDWSGGPCGGYGLHSLCARGKELGGELHLARRTAGGTEARLRLPLSPRPFEATMRLG